VYCPEEHYFITLIFDRNKQDMIINKTISDISFPTFVNWRGSNYKYMNNNDDQYRGSVKNYNKIDRKELDYLLNSEALFGRKFNKSCAVYGRKPKILISIHDYIIKNYENKLSKNSI
jgi:hypothetical protein